MCIRDRVIGEGGGARRGGSHDRWRIGGGGGRTIQVRLFARLVLDLMGQPSPRLWYFPGDAKTVMVLTGDAHSNPLSYLSLIHI